MKFSILVLIACMILTHADGSTLAFTSDRSGADEIWLIHLDTLNSV